MEFEGKKQRQRVMNRISQMTHLGGNRYQAANGTIYRKYTRPTRKGNETDQFVPEYKSQIHVRRIVTEGDCNTFLINFRNELNELLNRLSPLTRPMKSRIREIISQELANIVTNFGTS